MDVLLIPGFWLDASSWAPVVAALEAAGHRAHPVTPLGVGESYGVGGSVTLADQAGAVAEVVDTLDGPVVLVGHSGGGAVAHAVVDARPDRVARAVYVDSGPLGNGAVVNAELPVIEGMVPLPDWSFFAEEELRDMTEDIRAAVRQAALDVPPLVAAGPQHLSDPRRYQVPVTVVSTTMPQSVLRQLMAGGHPYVAELALVDEVDIIELPTGHWPQFTKPHELAALVVGIVNAAAGSTGSSR